MRHELKTIDEIDADEWDALVAGDHNCGIYQTYEFARYWNNYLRCKPLFLTLHEGDCIVGALLFFQQAPLHKTFFEKPLIKRALFLGMKMVPVYTWISGPVILDELQKEDIFKYILSKRDSIFKNYYIIRGSFKDYYDEESIGELIPIIKKVGFSVSERGTYVIDLDKTIEELWCNIKKPCRKNLNKADKFDVKIYCNNEREKVKGYYELYKKFRKGLKEQYFTFANFANQVKYLNSERTSMNFYVAACGDSVLAGLGVQRFNKNVYEVISARVTEKQWKKVPAGDLIKWQVIQDAKTEGNLRYDLMGADPLADDPKLQNIARFKAKFGGRFLKFIQFEKKR
ncbi:peptidoglycan bridge formation glycyltransferase FemA/FemB family protein [Candidatus Woesearchaeota archaeon]|nr:peptidoglycan bridge formation glycyltransferase FemA/FemB family protein [Candidatus Woesearchaeota archaeon]